MKKYIILLLLTGCAGSVSKPGATLADNQRDSAQCHFQVDKALGNDYDPFTASQLYNECLAAKGYH